MSGYDGPRETSGWQFGYKRQKAAGMVFKPEPTEPTRAEEIVAMLRPREDFEVQKNRRRRKSRRIKRRTAK